ncbi:MAG: C-GCAxxG-C-C family protein [Treponemataceae bacterium]|nr:C-GCAxxG-C-C family protein [Treponemataceae bacterium]
MIGEERAENGKNIKLQGRCNCAQAVIKAYQDKLSLDDETLMKISSGFGSGMGGMEGTCGAISGAVIVAGLLANGSGTGRISRSVVSKFKEKSGATICRDLKTPVNGKPLCECPQCVYNAIAALEETLSGMN